METCLNVISFHAQVAPVIVQNIPPSSDGLTQPEATLIAALVALVVAGVTAFGIWMNHRQHSDKEKVAAMERRRKEAVDALVEALEAGNVAWNLVFNCHNAASGDARGTPTNPMDVDSSFARCREIEAKLHLLALDESFAMTTMDDVLSSIWRELRGNGTTPDFRPAWDARSNLILSFRKTINTMHTKYDPESSELPMTPR